MKVTPRWFGLACLPWCCTADGFGPEAAGAASGRPTPAIERLAELIATQVLDQGAEAPVAVHLVAPSRDLARAFGTLLASRLAQHRLAPALVDAASPEAAEEVARRSGARSLVRLHLSIDQSTLQAQGDLLGTWVNFWSGRTHTRPSHPAAIIDALTPADAQAVALAALSLSTPESSEKEHGQPLVGRTVARFSLPPAALAAGDMNGDGIDEVLVLNDEEILAVALDGRILARRSHRSLPASATPCREPFGAVAFYRRPPRVAYFSSKRAKGELLEFDRTQGDFRALATIDTVPLGELGDQRLSGRWTPGENTFVCEGLPGQQAPEPLSALSIFQASNGLQLLTLLPDGKANWFQSIAGSSRSIRLDRLGTASALVDVDGDGRPELITTSPRYQPDPEQLRLFSEVQIWGTTGGKGGLASPLPTARWQSDIPRGRAIELVPVRLNARGQQGAAVGIWLPDGTGEIELFQQPPRVGSTSQPTSQK